MFTRRCVDDLISFGNRSLEQHHADLLSIHGRYRISIEGRTWQIRGIYPTADDTHDGLTITIKVSTPNTPFYNIFNSHCQNENVLYPFYMHVIEAWIERI